MSHVAGESRHGQNLTEHALVVAIHEATKGRESRNSRRLAIRQDTFDAGGTGESGPLSRKAFSANGCHLCECCRESGKLLQVRPKTEGRRPQGYVERLSFHPKPLGWVGMRRDGSAQTRSALA